MKYDEGLRVKFEVVRERKLSDGRSSKEESERCNSLIIIIINRSATKIKRSVLSY